MDSAGSDSLDGLRSSLTGSYREAAQEVCGGFFVGNLDTSLVASDDFSDGLRALYAEMQASLKLGSRSDVFRSNEQDFARLTMGISPLLPMCLPPSAFVRRGHLRNRDVFYNILHSCPCSSLNEPRPCPAVCSLKCRVRRWSFSHLIRRTASSASC